MTSFSAETFEGEPVDADCQLENRAESPGASWDQERHFTAPLLDFPPDPELVAQGWERRFMADPIRAKESAELYRSLGFEVLSRPVQPAELSAECSDCKLVVCSAYVTIYTRKF